MKKDSGFRALQPEITSSFSPLCSTAGLVCVAPFSPEIQLSLKADLCGERYVDTAAGLRVSADFIWLKPLRKERAQ